MMAKFNYIRSKKLMGMYRTIPCQNCFVDDGTVCGAHSNQEKHGKGKGIKASDKFCASLCCRCHYDLDNGKMLTKMARATMWNRAHERTKQVLTDKYGYEYLSIIDMKEAA